MDLWRTVLVLFRRWYVTVPAFLASLGLAAAAYAVIPREYQSSSVLVLTSPLAGGTTTTQPTAMTNPLLAFDRSLNLTAAIVIQQMNSPETLAALGMAPGGATSYQVTNGSSNPELLESGPFIFVQGTAPTPEAAQGLTELVTRTATEVLAQRQTQLKAPDSTHIGAETVVAATPGRLLAGSPLRAAAATAALAGLASLATVYGFESLMAYRRRRPAADSGDRAPSALAAVR